MLFTNKQTHKQSIVFPPKVNYYGSLPFNASFTAYELNCNFLNFSVTSSLGIHALRTKRPSFAAVSVTNQYEVGRDTRDQLTRL